MITDRITGIMKDNLLETAETATEIRWVVIAIKLKMAINQFPWQWAPIPPAAQIPKQD